VPYWDFDVPPDAPHLYDSSAAAIAASGLWDLSEAVTEPADRDRYRAAALTALETLCSDRFLARPDSSWQGMLKHGIYHFHKGLGVDESVAWGDHFFVEGLVKAVHGQAAAWGYR
jgi:unsaturated chondroitin disaccharide hydrolase